MKPSHLMLATMLAWPFAAQDAQARSLGQMLDRSGLAPGDIAVMETAALDLVAPLGRTGDARRWSNPESRSKGAVTLGRIEGNCAELVHRVATVRRPQPVTYRTWRCRTENGTWQVSPGPE
ncbi:hypothetical protein [Roseovarius sp. D22-M7]|uniref:hypothetical protein n=1 Tax=Roseovarius sp. D22-M7 TaxID=3127116 RepID=UPI0030100416